MTNLITAHTSDNENEVDENIDFNPFLDYLQTDKGHELASRTIGIVEDVKKAALEKSSSHAIFEKWMQFGVVIVVVLAASILSYFGKFETSVGVLFGTLVGYIFGKR